MQKEKSSWYASWFDTSYYHTLYKDRDYEEAQVLIDNLTEYLNLPEDAKVLDLACGRGRHAVYLASLGYDVTGVDLSPNSIQYAKAHEKELLHFDIHDMREPLTQKYDAIFNLFTSFGYFSDPADNAKTLKAIKDSLTETGFAVMDFMNVDKVIPNLVPEETKTVDGIDFNMTRRYENGFIIKDISFLADGKQHQYTEHVRALQLEDFEKMMEQEGIYLLDVFGDYKLHRFHKEESDRLIMIFK